MNRLLIAAACLLLVAGCSKKADDADLDRRPAGH